MSSSLEDRREFRELVHEADKARQGYFNATREVSQQERCLETIQVALKVSERETTTAQAAATDAQARVMGKDAHSSFVIS